MSQWKNKLQEYMEKAVRYACVIIQKEDGSNFISVDPAGFYGQTEMGFFDHVCSIVQDERKRCYKQGFLDGAKAGTADLAAFNAEREFDLSQKTNNQITAERSFNEWRE